MNDADLIKVLKFAGLVFVCAFVLFFVVLCGRGAYELITEASR